MERQTWLACSAVFVLASVTHFLVNMDSSQAQVAFTASLVRTLQQACLLDIHTPNQYPRTYIGCNVDQAAIVDHALFESTKWSHSCARPDRSIPLSRLRPCAA
eukprot:3983062-Amphidinium_carterae.1